jgi:hypothetical protein
MTRPSGRTIGFAVVFALTTAGALLVGWFVLGSAAINLRGEKSVAIGTFATALATALLALVTLYLGGLAREQARIAKQGLETQTQPFFTVGDISEFEAYVTRGLPDRGELLSLSANVRNAGIATGVVMKVLFLFEEDVVVAGGAIDPAVPPGGTTNVTGQEPESWSGFDTARNRVEKTEDYSVAVEYADVTGRNRGAVRLDVKRYGRNWAVRQIHWADSIEKVRTEPRFGTQPWI